jgi:hypothetical protein
MAMIKQKGAVEQEGRFIKIRSGDTTKIFVIDKRNGKLVEIS